MTFTYVYILQSVTDPERFYVGITGDLQKHLETHNASRLAHTSKFTPSQIKTTIAFRDKNQAIAFEKYLKSSSGRAFAKKRF